MLASWEAGKTVLESPHPTKLYPLKHPTIIISIISLFLTEGGFPSCLAHAWEKTTFSKGEVDSRPTSLPLYYHHKWLFSTIPAHGVHCFQERLRIGCIPMGGNALKDLSRDLTLPCSLLLHRPFPMVHPLLAKIVSFQCAFFTMAFSCTTILCLVTLEQQPFIRHTQTVVPFARGTEEEVSSEVSSVVSFCLCHPCIAS